MTAALLHGFAAVLVGQIVLAAVGVDGALRLAASVVIGWWVMGRSQKLEAA